MMLFKILPLIIRLKLIKTNWYFSALAPKVHELHTNPDLNTFMSFWYVWLLSYDFMALRRSITIFWPPTLYGVTSIRSWSQLGGVSVIPAWCNQVPMWYTPTTQWTMSHTYWVNFFYSFSSWIHDLDFPN